MHEKEVFPFDAPALNRLHALATPTLDRFFVLMTQLGYLWGVVPLDLILLLSLALRRRFREGLFFFIAITGSAILDIVAKNYFARTRPDLWLSLTPETTYSFPSGHAMGSATLGVALIILCWPTRWRWPITVASLVFVLLVGVSRVYLGVHYPSDILAGWSAAVAWVCGTYILVYRKELDSRAVIDLGMNVKGKRTRTEGPGSKNQSAQQDKSREKHFDERGPGPR
jgi:undecaprenyl-diphosphatase